MVMDTTLNWRDIFDIGRGMWDDVTRCRIAARDWGAAIAIHPAFGGPQSVIFCGDSMDGFVEGASWRTGYEKQERNPMTKGAWIERGPLTVWRQPLDRMDSGRLLGRLLDRRVASLESVGDRMGLWAQIYFRQGAFDHTFHIGNTWREPEGTPHRELLGLFVPYLKPSLRLYFSDS